MNGKGDAPRPLSVSYARYRDNYDRIFSGTGRVIGSCGHPLACLPEPEDIVMLATLARDGARAVRYGSLCLACWQQAEAVGSLLRSEAEVSDWLEGRREFTPW